MAVHEHFVVGYFVNLLIQAKEIYQFSVGLVPFHLICGCVVLPRMKTGVWMCDQDGEAPCSHPHSVGLHSTWTEEMSFAGVAWSHIPPNLIFLEFRYNSDILPSFGLYSFLLGFCLLCASVVLHSMWLLSSITWVSSSCPQYTQALLTHFLTAFLPFLLVALKFCEYIFAVWLLREWTHHNCEDGIAGVVETCKSLCRVFYKDGLCFQRIVPNSAMIQV